MVRVELDYERPAGSLGAEVAKLFGKRPDQMLEDDLRAFKQIIETGAIIRSDASVHSGMHAAQPPEASPRSDAPLHTVNSHEEAPS